MTFGSAEPVDYMEAPNGITGIVLAFILIFFAFIGFEDMANVAEEVKRPKKTLPRAIFLCIIITGIIYVLVALSAVRILNWEELGQSAAPLADVAHKALGMEGRITLSIIALFCYCQYSSYHSCSWSKNTLRNGKERIFAFLTR